MRVSVNGGICTYVCERESNIQREHFLLVKDSLFMFRASSKVWTAVTNLDTSRAKLDVPSLPWYWCSMEEARWLRSDAEARLDMDKDWCEDASRLVEEGKMLDAVMRNPL